jgi:hypothetical protein
MATPKPTIPSSGRQVKDPANQSPGPLAGALAQAARPTQAAPGAMPPPGVMRPPPPPPPRQPAGARMAGPMAIRPPVQPMPTPAMRPPMPMTPAAGGQPPIFSPLSVGNVPGAPAQPKYSNADLGEILNKLYRG